MDDKGCEGCVDYEVHGDEVFPSDAENIESMVDGSKNEYTAGKVGGRVVDRNRTMDAVVLVQAEHFVLVVVH